MRKLEIEGFKVDEKPIGKGRTGEVFRASRSSENKQYVVKRFNSMMIDRILIEDVLKRQKKSPDHNGIIKVVDFRLNAPPYYCISEYEPGKKLVDCYQFEESQAVELIEALADAMGHAHKHGVIHGNLHPGNIFYHIDENLVIKIRVSDFGAGMFGDVHYIDLEETAYFAPPEQLECLGADYKAGKAEKWDVYRFGAIAFWLLNHKLSRGLAYQKSRAENLAAAGGRPVPVDPYALSGAMKAELALNWRNENSPYRKLIESCLSLNPADRPKDMQEVRNQIAEILKSKEAEKNVEAKKETSAKAKPAASSPVSTAISTAKKDKANKESEAETAKKAEIDNAVSMATRDSGTVKIDEIDSAATYEIPTKEAGNVDIGNGRENPETKQAFMNVVEDHTITWQDLNQGSVAALLNETKPVADANVEDAERTGEYSSKKPGKKRLIDWFRSGGKLEDNPKTSQ